MVMLHAMFVAQICDATWSCGVQVLLDGHPGMCVCGVQVLVLGHPIICVQCSVPVGPKIAGSGQPRFVGQSWVCPGHGSPWVMHPTCVHVVAVVFCGGQVLDDGHPSMCVQCSHSVGPYGPAAASASGLQLLLDGHPIACV